MQSKPKYDVLKLSQIARHPELQPRAAIDIAIVEDYRDMLKDGAKFPAVTVFFDKTYYHLADGWHRYEAHQSAGVGDIRAEIYEGSFRDAQLHALGANANHGLRRTNKDKRRAVGIMLADAEWAKWGDSEIARRCHVSNHLVADVRRESSEPHLGEFKDRSDEKLTHLKEFTDAAGEDHPTHLPENADSQATPPENVRTVRRNGTVYQQKTSNIGRKTREEPSPDKSGDAPTQSAPFRDDATEDSSSDDDFGPSPEEIAEAEEMERANREKYDQLVEVAHADDKMGELMKLVSDQSEEIGRLRAQIRSLRERQTGLMNEKIQLDAQAKMWMSTAKKLGWKPTRGGAA